MTRSRRTLLLAAALAVLAIAVLGVRGRAGSTHATVRSELGIERRFADLEAVVDEPGSIEVVTVVSTEWVAPRSGLINLDAPEARSAGLEDGEEPIEIFFHVVRHPRRGTFIIDAGVSRAMRDTPDQAAVRGMLARMLKVDRMTFDMPLGDWLAAQPEPIRGVFFTHVALDHITGAPDLPRSRPLYAGPGDTRERALLYMFSQGTTDRCLEGLPPIAEWPFSPDPDGRFAGVVDVFGDGSFWALWTPGHTPGHTSYLARTAHGPVLFTGDVSHTRWGWEHDVESGTFNSDRAGNANSLSRLRRFVLEHPAMDVRLGHQYLHPAGHIR